LSIGFLNFFQGNFLGAKHPSLRRFTNPCPLDIVIVSHLGGFVKGFSKLFLKKFCRPASLSITSVPPDIVYYSRYWDKKQVVNVHKFSTNFLVARSEGEKLVATAGGDQLKA
jgi:hypothetical protein